jgi:hypothetical protein
MPKKELVLSFAIMAHESRKEYIPYLLSILGNYTPVLMDKGKKGDSDNLGIWLNCRRSWLAYNKNADFHFVIQDDAILTSDFIKKVKKKAQIAYDNDYVLNLYLGNRQRFRTPVKQARKKNKDHLLFQSIHHEIALGMRTDRIEDMIKFCDLEKPILDKVINQYVHDQNMNVYCPLPSLVDHRKLVSLHSHNKSPIHSRTAIWFES